MFRLIPMALRCLLAGTMLAQAPTPLDLGRSIQPFVHKPLPEEYIWTAGDATVLRPDHGKYPWNKPELQVDPHLFRRTFRLDAVPPHATLYLAGPREAHVYLNGRPVGDFASDPEAPIGFRVFHADVAHALRPGINVLAIEAIRGRGMVCADATPELSQLAYGEVLAVKLLAARFGHDGPALVLSDKNWQSASATPAGERKLRPRWAEPGDSSTAWRAVYSLGPIEGNREFFQWSADAGMYGWPGYEGMTPPLGHYLVPPAAVTHVFVGTGNVQTSIGTHEKPALDVRLTRGSTAHSDLESPAILVDFGRELAGRVMISSTSDKDALLSIAYGESEIEALATGLAPSNHGGNYLGTNLLDIPANGMARGPKSAFRYVRIRFLRGASDVHFSILAEGIAYPVTYAGSFESSDPLLNRIWETGAYTAHLCMQDDLWDAPKRDRGRWAGDINVEGRVISTVFGESALLERSLAALAPARGRQVNGIPGYSALWITSLASLYAHSGDLGFIHAQHDALVRVLATMDASLDPATGLFGKGGWTFVDWAPELHGNTQDAIAGTNLQYVLAYRAATRLLRADGDTANAARAKRAADELTAHLRSAISASTAQRTDFLGLTPQVAALLIESGVASTLPPGAYDLTQIKQNAQADPVISPYLNATVLDALTRSDHQREALAWLRTYWGGMLAEGATSFWEAYDLRWQKSEFHLGLQADGLTGFYVSLAHGWSSGPTAWLSENILGIRDAADGYGSVTIAPRLLGLAFARGTVPTPYGAIAVSATRSGTLETLDITIPAGVEHALLSLPEQAHDVTLNGRVVSVANALRELAPGTHKISFTPGSL